jgi:hypothetical protein
MTVVVQAMASDEMRARSMAIWAGAFVGLLPLGRSSPPASPRGWAREEPLSSTVW